MREQIERQLLDIVKMQDEIRSEGHAGWGNGLDDVAETLREAEARITELERENAALRELVAIKPLAGSRLCDNGHVCDDGYPCPECAKAADGPEGAR